MRFTYAANWLTDASRPAISFSLPKQKQPFTQRQCRPFFAGLLPEEAQRDLIAGALGISKGNDFAFLEATTQRYMHLSPAAIDAAIRLLETGPEMNGAAVEK
jgi:HipA-like protein